MLKESLYYAKILLFGEYGIIEDSMGLSIPYTFFKGKFEFSSEFNEEQKSSNKSIAKFVAHLKEMNHSKAFWAHVENLCPNYLKLRKWLKQHGKELFSVG